MNPITKTLSKLTKPAPGETGPVGLAPTVAARDLFKRFWPDARPLRRWIILGLLLLALIPAIEAVEIYLFKVVVDEILVPRDLDPFLWIALAYVGLNLASGLISYADEYLSTFTGERFLLSVRTRVFGHLLHSPADSMNERRLGDLIARLTSDVGAIEALVLDGVSVTVLSLLRFLFFLGAAFLIDWQLALLSLVVTPFFWLVIRRVSRLIKGAASESRRRSGSLTSFAEQRLSHLALIQAHGREETEQARFEELGRSKARARLASARIGGLLHPVTDLLEIAAALAVMGAGTWAMAAGRLSLGELLAFLTYLAQLYRPVRDMAGLVDTISEASAAGERVVELLDGENPVREREGAVDPGRVSGAIELRGVTFAYPGAVEPILNDASLVIPPGGSVLVRGASGVGKSTLIKLLLRFNDPQEGSITLDGRDFRDLRIQALRESITVLFQESLILEGTIRENIEFGKSGATMDEVISAARRVDAHDFVSRLPDGYETEAGHRGRRLSGGQRQRIALARALLRDGPVLVLDEPTSELDASTARLVISATERVMAGRTTIVISHDPLLFGIVDRVVELDGGRLHEIEKDDQRAAVV
jgi:ATP-binding cassette, subfamily B, bacterial